MDVLGERFQVRQEGREDAPALMLSHSLGCDLRMWDAQAAELARHFRVIRYDSRGHGGSVAAPGPYSIEQLGRDALAILDALGVRRTHWLGLSMGGMTGQWLLAHAGDRFDRAILANTASHYPDSRNWNARIATVRARGMAPVADGVVERWFTPEFRSRRPDAVEPLKATLLATDPAAYAACCAALRDMDLRESNRRIAAPTLVVAGSNDLATPPELGRAIADRIPGARFREIAAAHISNVEQPADFAALALDFLLRR